MILDGELLAYFGQRRGGEDERIEDLILSPRYQERLLSMASTCPFLIFLSYSVLSALGRTPKRKTNDKGYIRSNQSETYIHTLYQPPSPANGAEHQKSSLSSCRTRQARPNPNVMEVSEDHEEDGRSRSGIAEVDTNIYTPAKSRDISLEQGRREGVVS
jgi:hypothetical protein